MTLVPILLTVSTKYLVTFVSFIRQKQSTRHATSFTFAYRFYLCGAVIVVSEIRPTSKMSVTSVEGNGKVGERARRARHAIARRLVTDMCYIVPTTFMTCITFALSAIAPLGLVIT